MNTTQKTLASIAIVVGASMVATSLYYRTLINDMQSRFPECDRKIIKKAYRVYLMRSLTRKYDLQDLTYDQMDDIFLSIIHEVQI